MQFFTALLLKSFIKKLRSDRLHPLLVVVSCLNLVTKQLTGTVPGQLSENHGLLWRSAIRNRDNLNSMKSAVGLFELALCAYKQSVSDSPNKLELIRLLEQFKEEATTQKKSFYETSQAKSISASYFLVSKHLLLSKTSL